MKTQLAILAGITVAFISRTFRLGAGVTWAGEIALRIDKDILPKLIPAGAKVILVAGTNGKTTTTKLLKAALHDYHVVTNESGANLLNGIVGSVLQQKPGEYYLLEVDENNLMKVTKEIASPSARNDITIVLLNLFRDQLDRYGEVDKIAKEWENLGDKGNLVINADDPQLAWLGKKLKGRVYYFGLGDKKFFLPKMQHATDSIYCPNCGTRLKYQGFYFSHLGEYLCPKCGFEHPKNDKGYRGNEGNMAKIEGIYNYYNVLAALLTAQVLGIKNPDFSNFKPAFGRSEEVGGAKILLSKNPAGFNESLRTVINSKRKGPLLLVLNDRIPDGTDVSWIWDVDFEELQEYKFPIFVSGDRKLDLALRLKYGGVGGFEVCDLKEVAERAIWILATYSAMLEVRKILTGKAIL